MSPQYASNLLARIKISAGRHMLAPVVYICHIDKEDVFKLKGKGDM